ncbi:hypothetical protein [Paenibacillus sp. UNC496MF]|uniref:hypothetical protein n=1 Tax=Paenibacillus sp. UNC496MF TaxID=1502753 RepID=UPI001C4329F0|nr:hypothetical protein [Paenibacillus sp. UNC496MF]
MADIDQMELFPIATKEDLKAAKSLLSRYRRMKTIIDDFDRHGADQLALKQQSIYSAYRGQLDKIERAVNLIPDDEIRRMVELRYIKGQPHHVTVARFELWHPSTVDRKIKKGIEAVANTLILWS